MVLSRKGEEGEREAGQACMFVVASFDQFTCRCYEKCFDLGKCSY